MRKVAITIIIVLGLALVLAALSIQAFPEWMSIPGGALVLLGIALRAVLSSGKDLAEWVDLLFPKDRKPKEPGRAQSQPASLEIGGGVQQRGGTNLVASLVDADQIGGTRIGHVDHLEVHTPKENLPQLPQPSVDEALALLESLPLDEIPPVAPLPPGSYMPLSPNPGFVGREDDLKALAAALKGGETAAIGQTAAYTGMGGIGKTQLAAAFAHRYGQFFAGGVYWLSFADPNAVEAEIAGSGMEGGLGLPPGYPGMPLAEQMRLVCSAWHEALPRLLVFDNCEEPALLEQWRPASGGCRVLVTSRRGYWEATLGVKTLPLDVLPLAESLALLRVFRPDLPAGDPDLTAIAEELGRLPLALQLSGSYLARYRHEISPAAYLAQLRQPGLLDHPALAGSRLAHSPTGHENQVARTFALSFERLDAADEIDTLAVGLLKRMAYFAPGEAVPRDLLRLTMPAAESGAAADPQAADGLRFADGLTRLCDLGLIEIAADGAPRLHRLLAAFARGLPGQEQAARQTAAAVLGEANRLNNAGYPAALLAWQSHLRYLTDRALPGRDETAAGLGNALGYHLSMIADYEGARPYYEQALAIRMEALGEKHPDTARSLNNLGGLLDSMGDYEGARPYYEQALAINREALGEKHPDTAISLNNLGMLLATEGRLADAAIALGKAAAICSAVLGPEHPNTQTVRRNLADIQSRLA